MNNSRKNSGDLLPKSLRKQLDLLRNKLRWTEGSKGILAAIGLLLVSWLVVLGSDRFWDTPQPLLILASVTGWASALWILRLGYRLAIEQPRHDENLAKITQGRFPSLGDRLLGVIELCDPRKKTSEHSAALREAAVSQVANETAGKNLNLAVDLKLLKRVAFGFAGLATMAMLCATIMPKAAFNAWERWSNPFNPAQRYTFAEITSFPAEKIVALGEPYQILCTLDPDSFWLPQEAILTAEDGTEHVATLNGHSYLFELEGVREDASYAFSVGDADANIQVTPLARPSLNKTLAQVEYPAYLGYPANNLEITSRTITAPVGSLLTIHGFANRPLQQAMTVGGGPQQSPSVKANVDGNQFHLQLGLVEKHQVHRLVWQDSLGLSCNGVFQFEVVAKADEPPSIEFPEITAENYVQETGTFDLTAKADDDFGIKNLTFSWTLRNAGTEELETVAREWNNDSRTMVSFQGTHSFSPSLLNAPNGSTIVIRAHTSDWRENAEPVYSREILVLVESVEANADRMRKEIEDLLGKLSEITNAEEDILMKTLQMQALDSEKASEKSAQRKMETAASEQEDLAKQLEQMSKEGVEILREAMKNPLFDEQTLKEWNQTMQAMKELSEGKMQEASQQLSQSASSPSESQRSESLSEAENSEREIIEELQDLQGEINEQLDELEAMTLAQRLRKIKRTEDSLSKSLMENLSETIGLRTADLSKKQKLLNDNLFDRQTETHDNAKELQSEISRYHERTQKPQYGEVSEQMDKTKAADGLLNVAELINRNVSLNATTKLGHWAVKFEEWAKLLEPQDDGGGGGGEGGGGEGEDITEQLIALLKIRKGEADLRRHTILLDKEKKDVGKELKEKSDELDSQQRKLMMDLTDVQIDLAKEELNPLFDDAHTAMASAADRLKKQDSGQTTVASETKAFDLLSDIVNLIVESQCQACKKPGASSQSQAAAAAMQFLLQQYGQGEGQGEGEGMGMSSMGGGSRQGGDTDSNPATQRTNDGGDSSDPRSRFRKANGWSGGLPSEFREALENYFREIEK